MARSVMALPAHETPGQDGNTITVRGILSLVKGDTMSVEENGRQYCDICGQTVIPTSNIPPDVEICCGCQDALGGFASPTVMKVMELTAKRLGVEW
jgi:hypothetical protein